MKLAASAALLLALAAPAFAQTDLVEVNDDTMIEALGLDADGLDDMDVHDTGDREIGEVEEVVGTGPDAATALAVEFEDEVAGADEETRVVPLDRFTLDGDRLVFDGTPEDIAGFPAWDD